MCIRDRDNAVPVPDLKACQYLIPVVRIEIRDRKGAINGLSLIHIQEKGTQKAPLHIKKYIENAIPYKEPVGGINLAYV